MDAWKKVGEIPTAWLPARVRTRDQAHAEWDNYATQDDCRGSWLKSTPESVRDFSAVGYFFGKNLNKVLNLSLIHI